jgi:hypothetical protein
MSPQTKERLTQEQFVALATPVDIGRPRRCHGKSFHSAAVIAAHVAAGWSAVPGERGITYLIPPAEPNPRQK